MNRRSTGLGATGGEVKTGARTPAAARAAVELWSCLPGRQWTDGHSELLVTSRPEAACRPAPGASAAFQSERARPEFRSAAGRTRLPPGWDLLGVRPAPRVG
ncbi:hypothetical protein P7K49_016553 [Saguinus oedipus]|uniref:Uncharacterized protein n=1 Tax=Saguinus oedipus TaxID=9490 RepID=A0ABQ9VCE6_SAGOE|nr:hypothetical protein P7K49_016553 [Saguinus oedipus]